MKKSTAQLLLGFDADSQIGEEALEIKLEEAIFTEASFFMRRVFIPKLVEPRITKLNQLSEAATAFGIHFKTLREKPNLKEGFRSLSLARTIPDLIAAYTQAEMKVKLALSNEENPGELIDIYREWKRLFLTYADKYIALVEQSGSDFPTMETVSVSISQHPDYNSIITESTDGNLSESVYSEYCRLKKMTA